MLTPGQDYIQTPTLQRQCYNDSAMTLLRTALRRGRIEHYKMNVAQFTETETLFSDFEEWSKPTKPTSLLFPSKRIKVHQRCSKGHLFCGGSCPGHGSKTGHSLKSTEGYNGYKWLCKSGVFGTFLFSPVRHVTHMTHVVDCQISWGISIASTRHASHYYTLLLKFLYWMYLTITMFTYSCILGTMRNFNTYSHEKARVIYIKALNQS